eukprot:5884468-Pleurochrysis_carterae.AAC.3
MRCDTPAPSVASLYGTLIFSPWLYSVETLPCAAMRQQWLLTRARYACEDIYVLHQVFSAFLEHVPRESSTNSKMELIKL